MKRKLTSRPIASHLLNSTGFPVSSSILGGGGGGVLVCTDLTPFAFLRSTEATILHNVYPPPFKKKFFYFTGNVSFVADGIIACLN